MVSFDILKGIDNDSTRKLKTTERRVGLVRKGAVIQNFITTDQLIKTFEN